MLGADRGMMLVAPLREGRPWGGSSATCSFILRYFAVSNGPFISAGDVLVSIGCTMLRSVYEIAHNRHSLNATGLEADDRSGSGS